ncbi:beta-ketoacyl-[acyl-carrier-protein] synthase family protein [Streptomyces sp. NPDC035033]|uniref:beta-ketoacyl-[acyl-carrier-protein] synthase family protein n=1 Tax=Streptomyces sp. NPDC035033 TaxID=3155368 RepID=UPI0033EE9053
MPLTHHNVAVTGIGLVTPAGLGTEASWATIRDGVPTASHDPALAGLGCDLSCRVPGFDATALLGRRTAWRLDRFTHLALVAAREAVADAGLDPGTWDGARVAVVLGNSLGGTATTEEQYRTYYGGAPDEVSPLTVPKSMSNMVAGYVAMDLGARGPSLVTATACASGSTAIGTARQLLVLGQCDIAVVGGTESALTPATVTALHHMGALTRRTREPDRASRPFDADRDGFVPAEGAGVLVLEREADAAARGAAPYAFVRGFGASSDAHHATAPDPEGAGIERAVRAALADAGLAPGDIAHVNAHGTSTPLNDATEATALGRVFGHGAAVTSVKGVTGHTLAAAGAVEAAVTALTLHHGVIPPTAGTVSVDPAIDLDIVLEAPRKSAPQAAVSTSLGFGGHNAALVLTTA